MNTNLVLSDQIGQAFLEELNDNTNDAVAVKNKLKGYSECNPDPAGSPATMDNAFNTAVTDSRVIARFRELRDSLPVSNFAVRKQRRFNLVPFYESGYWHPSQRPHAGIFTEFNSGYTDSVDITFYSELQPGQYDYEGYVISDLAGLERFRENSNSLRIVETGVYLVHGVYNCRINTTSENQPPDYPTWRTSDPNEVLRHGIYISVNSDTSAAQSGINQEAGLDIAEKAIVNRLDTYYVKELHSGKFTKNEISKNTIKTRGFSTYMKLMAGDIVSLQWQRTRAIATYGDGDSSDALCFYKYGEQGTQDTDNWFELVRML